jgi:hypothetical protein
MAFTSITKEIHSYALPITITPKPIQLIEVEAPIVKEVKIVSRGHSDYLLAIGFRESTNNYKAVNQYGYLGKYQFGRRTLDALGFKDVSNREFLNNPEIQEEAMQALLEHNQKILRRQIKRYDGVIVHGVYVTESGILAAAHLAGPGNVKKFFRKGYEFKDGNGTKMTSYMTKFSGYELAIR